MLWFISIFSNVFQTVVVKVKKFYRRKHSNHLYAGLVWNSNGRKLSWWQMVCILECHPKSEAILRKWNKNVQNLGFLSRFWTVWHVILLGPFEYCPVLKWIPISGIQYSECNSIPFQVKAITLNPLCRMNDSKTGDKLIASRIHCKMHKKCQRLFNNKGKCCGLRHQYTKFK